MMISLLPQKVFVTLLIDWGLLKLNFPNQKTAGSGCHLFYLTDAILLYIYDCK